MSEKAKEKVYKRAIEKLEHNYYQTDDVIAIKSLYYDYVNLKESFVIQAKNYTDIIEDFKKELKLLVAENEELNKQIKAKDNLLNKYQDEVHIKGGRNYEKYRKV